MHPAPRRCSSVECSRYSPSSRLALGDRGFGSAGSRCEAGLSPRAVSRAGARDASAARGACGSPTRRRARRPDSAGSDMCRSPGPGRARRRAVRRSRRDGPSWRHRNRLLGSTCRPPVRASTLCCVSARIARSFGRPWWTCGRLAGSQAGPGGGRGAAPGPGVATAGRRWVGCPDTTSGGSETQDDDCRQPPGRRLMGSNASNLRQQGLRQQGPPSRPH